MIAVAETDFASLREEFAAALRDAKKPHDQKFRFSHLHYIISGPPASGKTTQAEAFARGLKRDDVVTGEIVQIFSGSITSEQQAKDVIRRAKNGVLIVDEARAAGGDKGQQALMEQIMRSIDGDICVVLMIGSSQEVNRLLASNQPLRDRVRIIEMKKSFTREEREKYDQLQEEHKQELDDLHNGRFILKNPIRAMKPLRLKPFPAEKV